MALPNVGEKTLVFRNVEGCMCDGCKDKMRKLLRQNHRNVSIHFDEGDEKLTIRGSNLDPKMVIAELATMKRKFTLDVEEDSTLDKIEEQITVHRTEASSSKARAMVVYNRQPPANHYKVQFIDSPASSKRPRFSSMDNHEHKLQLKNYDKRFTCDGCKEEGFKKRYRCKYCDYELHEDCMHPKLTISHELFGKSIFKFSHEKPTCSNLCRVHKKSCEACGNVIHGYSYHCENDDVYLHPMCANFKGKICIQGETFTLENKSPFQCFWCDGNEKQTNSGWAYVSKGTKCQLHVNCVAKIAHEAWKERGIEGGNDAYLIVLEKRLNWSLVKNNKKGDWSKGGKLVKMILVFARTIIGILLGDPTVILASMLVEVIKN